MSRKSLPARIRFEILKRDKFTCRYCGAKAPDALLEVDHIKPVKDGGTDDPLNLVASCERCNGGKSCVPLDLNAPVVASREEAERLQTRAEQVRLMAEWHHELNSVGQDESALINSILDSRFGFTITSPSALKAFVRSVNKAGFARFKEVVDATEKWADCQARPPSYGDVFEKVKKLLRYSAPSECPKSAAAYVAGIIRNRFQPPWGQLAEIKTAVEALVESGDAWTLWKDLAVSAPELEDFCFQLNGAFQHHLAAKLQPASKT